MPVEKKQLFILSPIGSRGSETRSFFDKTKKHLISMVCVDYDCIRADDISKPGTITSQIADAIIDSELVIADLSRLNPNVFYELAIRHATGKPVILIAEHGTNIPFDIKLERVVFYSHDPDDLDESRDTLSKFVKAVEQNDFEVESPLRSKISIERTKTISDIDLLEKMDLIMEKLDIRDSVFSGGPSDLSSSVNQAILYNIRRVLGENPEGLKIGEIAKELLITRQHAVIVIDYLMVQSVIYRTQDKNGEYIYKLLPSE